MAALFKLTSEQRRRIAQGLLWGIGGIGWLAFFLIPQWKIRVELRPQAHTLERELKVIRRKLSEQPALEEELTRLKAQYELPAQTLTVEEQIPELLETIAKAARSSEVNLLMVRPKADYTQLKPGLSGYLELPVQVQASAGYHQIGAFLDALERSESLLRLAEIDLRSDPKDIWHHRVDVVFQAYLVPGSTEKSG